MIEFNELLDRLDQLALDAAALDRRRGEHHRPLFDQQLFHCQARLLVPCVAETKSTCENIIREKAAGRLTHLRAEFLTDTLLAQMAAIQRELSTQKIRKNEIKHSSFYRKPINQLYQELAQHNEWERRLREMVYEKEQQLNASSAFEQPQLQKALLATEQRLARCSEAKLKLERQITYRERHQ